MRKSYRPAQCRSEATPTGSEALGGDAGVRVREKRDLFVPAVTDTVDLEVDGEDVEQDASPSRGLVRLDGVDLDEGEVLPAADVEKVAGFESSGVTVLAVVVQRYARQLYGRDVEDGTFAATGP